MSACNTETAGLPEAENGRVALIGHPNVGKSALFQQLTGQRVMISNYPGTTVEIARGAMKGLPGRILVDTPGVVTFPAQSEDEQVTEKLLLEEPLHAILQVGDAKNLQRTLLLSLLLAETGLPMVLALNMSDEARQRGLELDHAGLSQALGAPVIPTAAIHRQGVAQVQAAVEEARPPRFRLEYPQPIESALAQMEALLPPAAISARALGLLYLSGDRLCEAWLAARLAPQAEGALQAIRQAAAESLGAPPARAVLHARLDWIRAIQAATARRSRSTQDGLAGRLGRLTTHPLWGLLILAGVLYSVYWFVGVFGAGTLVGWLEEELFNRWINPPLIQAVRGWLPVPLLADLLVGEYGLWTMAMTYALALILPIVSTFFLAFSLLEDSGYLPRLAALSNRFFALLGLNGKAVLPMVLGLGCVTMATLTTRVLETRRERLLATLLLALAVPCSAQLGVVVGMLAGISLTAGLIWGGVVLGVLCAVGWLAARLVPGQRSDLLVELPPLRLPVFSNVALKTLARLEWYLKEVLPMFLIGTLVMFALDKTGALAWLIEMGKPLVVGWLGLPEQASAAFIMGFLRRDFGATGLFLMGAQNLLDPRQVVVAMVTITLFIPCVASVMISAKERGWRVALGMVALVTPVALLVGGLLRAALAAIGWGAG
jgi:ferrous iron transport protein B